MAAVALVVLPAIAMAFALRPFFGGRGEHLCRLAFGLYLGAGAFALVHVLGLLAGGSIGVLLSLEVALAAAFVVAGRARRDAGTISALPSQSFRARVTGAASLLLSLLVTGLGFSLRSEPFGSWDSWAIWTLHARFLHRGRSGAWTDMFSETMGWSHPDYPLLVPASIARVWSITGSDGAATPWLVALLSTLGLPLLLFAVLSRLRGPIVGGIGALAAAASPRVIEAGAAQYADVPLAGYFAATIALMAFAYGEPHRRLAFLALAGLTSSLSAWTKNEGISFALVAAAVLFLMAAPERSRSRAREAAVFLAGASPGLAALALFKARLAPPETAFKGALEGLVTRWLDPERHLLVLRAAGAELLDHHVLVLGLLALSVVVLGPAPPRRRRIAIPGLVVLSIQAAVYYAVYIVTPLDQEWHVSHSIHRLLVQLAPSCILVLLLLTGDSGNEPGASEPASLPSDGGKAPSVV